MSHSTLPLNKPPDNAGKTTRIRIVEFGLYFPFKTQLEVYFAVEVINSGALSGDADADLIIISASAPGEEVNKYISSLRPDFVNKPVPVLVVFSGDCKPEAFPAADDCIPADRELNELMLKIGFLLGQNSGIGPADTSLTGLLGQVPAVIAVLKGPDHVFEVANEKYRELVGRHRNIIGMPVRDALPEVVAQGFIGLLDNVYRSGVPFFGNEVKVAIKQNGDELKEIYMNFIYNPMRNGEGDIEGIFVHGVDVSDLVHARLEAQTTGQRLSAIINQATAGIAQTDLSGHFVLVNEGYCRLLGYSSEELKQLTMKDVTHPDDWPQNVELIGKMVLTGESFTIEKRYIHKNGSSVWVSTSLAVIQDTQGKPLNIVSVVIDISDRKVAEERLKKSEQFFKTYSEALPHMAFIANKEGDIIFYNQRWYDYIGQMGDTEGWGWVEKPIHHPDDTKKTIETWSESLKKGTPYRIEYRLRRFDGQYRWHLGRAEPVRDADGEIELWLGTNTDIHEQKIAQEQLEALTENLENLVLERTRALQRSNDDLQQFAHVASHDLKEPVRKIRIFVNMLSDRLSASGDKVSADYISRIHSAAERLKTMIEGVLAYSSVNGVKQSVETVDLNEIFRHVQTDLDLLIQEKGARINISNLPVIKGAPVLLYQLFYNLFNNSLKFIRAGVIPEITVTCHEVSLNGDEAVCIKVTDNGIGFSNEYAEKIFETFTRLNTKDLFEGTGLGLSLGKKIVERHGGTISANGVPDQGATFTITLPRSQNQLSVI